MKKIKIKNNNTKGFTLIEVIISIILFGLISTILIKTTDNLKNQIKFFNNKKIELNEKTKILNLLRMDFDRSIDIKINNENKNYSFVTIIGSNNSLYNNDKPFIIYFVNKEYNSLIRLESNEVIKFPLILQNSYHIKSDVIGTNCDIFKVFNSNNNKNNLLYLKFNNESPFIIETTK